MDARTQLLRDALERNTRPGEYAKLLLYDLVQTFMPVPEDLRERYEESIAGEEYRHLREYEATWAERLMLRGFFEGKRQTLKRQLTSKFGQLPPWIEGRIDALTSAETLDRCLDRVLTAATLEEVGLGG